MAPAVASVPSSPCRVPSSLLLWPALAGPGPARGGGGGKRGGADAAAAAGCGEETAPAPVRNAAGHSPERAAAAAAGARKRQQHHRRRRRDPGRAGGGGDPSSHGRDPSSVEGLRPPPWERKNSSRAAEACQSRAGEAGQQPAEPAGGRAFSRPLTRAGLAESPAQDVHPYAAAHRQRTGHRERECRQRRGAASSLAESAGARRGARSVGMLGVFAAGRAWGRGLLCHEWLRKRPRCWWHF